MTRRKSTIAVFCAFGLILLFPAVGGAQGEKKTTRPKGLEKVDKLTHQQIKAELKKREKTAPGQIKERLKKLRADKQNKKWSFEMSYVPTMDFEEDELRGVKAPPDLKEKKTAQDRKARDFKNKHHKKEPVVSSDPIVSGSSGSTDGGDFRQPFWDIDGYHCWLCETVPAKFNYVVFNAVSGTRNQGACGSCWAHTTQAVVEAEYLWTFGPYRQNTLGDSEKWNMIDSSEQDILDNNQNGRHCNGGWWSDGFDPVVDRGFSAEADYPYQEVRGSWNASAPRKTLETIWGYVDLGSGSDFVPDVMTLKKALLEYGPLAVAVNVTSPWYAYTDGVFDACGDPGGINHAVTLVGWDDSKGAWLIKNSWDYAWGIKGYMWIKYDCNKIGYGAAYFDIAGSGS